MTSRILVSGVSGPIGTALLPALSREGYEVVRLVRGRAVNERQISWTPAEPLAASAASGFDALIHLAGETIVGRWTQPKKKKIRDSRVLGTQNLAQALAQTSAKPKVFICSSAVGYYGDRGDEVLTESSAAGRGFLADVCREWESATQPAANQGVRTVQIRTGVVLSPKGGALGRMLTPFRMGAGGRIGDGHQWMSWIDVEDLVRAILHILKTDSLSGPVNMVGAVPVTNTEFTKTLASVLGRPAVFAIPAFAVKLAFGEMGETVLLGSQRVEPAKLTSSGFAFRFRTLRESLEHILGG